MKRSVHLVALTFLLLAGARANADFIQWSYNWDRNPVSVLSDHGTGSVAFTNEPTRNATGSSDTIATNLQANSLANASSPDTLSSTGAYSLTLTLTDKASGQSGQVTFTGKLGGTFSAQNANITNQFSGALTQSLLLGANSYTVTIGPYTPPGPPSSTKLGSIGAHVDVFPAGHTTGGGSAPEPSTLLLALVGLGGSGVASWRRRRAAQA